MSQLEEVARELQAISRDAQRIAGDLQGSTRAITSMQQQAASISRRGVSTHVVSAQLQNAATSVRAGAQAAANVQQLASRLASLLVAGGSGGGGSGGASPGAGPGGASAQSNQTVATAAQTLIQKATAAEPAMTAVMQALAAEVGGQLVGLEHRIKGQERVEEKISEDMRDDHLSVEKAAADVRDVLRYTIQQADDQYAKSAINVLASLRSQGYAVTMKNYWTVATSPYQGVNAQLLSPDGQWVELQFHTASSLAAKEASHPLYKQQRVLDPSDPMWADLAEKMFTMSAPVLVPPGVSGIK